MSTCNLRFIPSLFTVFLALGPGVLFGTEIRVIQITHTKEQEYASLSLNGDANKLAFIARNFAADGGHKDTREIWLWEEGLGLVLLAEDVMARNLSLSLSADGRSVAFSSSSNPVDKNPRNYEQIFLWTAHAGFRQITDNRSPREEYLAPQINADGSRIAFVNVGEYSFGGRLLMWSELKPLIQEIGAGIGCAINADGTRIAFLSGPPSRRQIFLWLDDGKVVPVSDKGQGNVSNVSLDAAGTRMAFRGGVRGDDSTIFIWREGLGVTEIEQGRDPVISGDGRTVLFKPRSSPEVLLWTEGQNIIRLLNAGQNYTSSYDGRKIAFTSDLDLTGENPNRWEQVFLAEIIPD